MRGFAVWNKRARVLHIFLVRSCQDLLEHKSWLLYSAQYLCIIVLNSSFHSAQIRPKSHSYMVDIYLLLLFLFFCCNLCSSHKSRARYFCKKNRCNFFFRLNHLSSVVAGFLPETSSFPIYQTCVGTVFWWGWRRLVGWRNCNIIMFKIQFIFFDWFWYHLIWGCRVKKQKNTHNFSVFLGSGFVFIWKFWKRSSRPSYARRSEKWQPFCASTHFRSGRGGGINKWYRQFVVFQRFFLHITVLEWSPVISLSFADSPFSFTTIDN